MLCLDPRYEPQDCDDHLHDAEVAQPLLHAPRNELPQCVAIAQVAHRSVPPGVQRTIKGDGCKIGVCRAGMGLQKGWAANQSLCGLLRLICLPAGLLMWATLNCRNLYSNRNSLWLPGLS